MAGAALVGHASGDQALIHIAPAGYPEALLVQICTLAGLSPEQLICDRGVDDPGVGFAVTFQADGNGEMGQAVQKICRAVEGIDNPAIGIVLTHNLVRFLGEKPVFGPCLFQFIDNCALCLLIGNGDEICRPFA